METSEVDLKEEGETARIGVKGFISETCVLFEYDLSKYNDVYISFQDTTFINSLGIRLWMEWFRSPKVPGSTQVYLEYCVPSVVSQFNMINGFISDNCEVLSLYANYYVEDSAQEHRILLEKGKDFVAENDGQPGWVKIAEEIEKEDGEVLILDTIKEKYFSFLGKLNFQNP